MGRSPGKRPKSRSTLVILLLLGGLFSAPVVTTEVNAAEVIAAEITPRIYVASAANFYAPLKKLIADYQGTQDDTGEILISTGSSGSLYRQIKHGSPHQIFLSADSYYPEQLELDQLIVPNSRRTYAIGELLLWHPGVELDSLQQLSDYDLNVAIANPKTAPYGKAAQQVLKKLNPATPWRLIIGASIAQTHQFIHSGNAPAGLISRSQIEPNRTDVKTIPNNWYTPLIQQMILTRKAEHHPQAHKLFAYLSSEPARRIIEESGYLLPERPTSSSESLAIPTNTIERDEMAQDSHP